MFTTTARRLGALITAIVVLSWLLGFFLVGGCATVRPHICEVGGSLVTAAEERHASAFAIILARVAMAVACPKPEPTTRDGQAAETLTAP